MVNQMHIDKMRVARQLATIALLIVAIQRVGLQGTAADVDDNPSLTGSLTADLNLVPRDGGGFLSVRVAELYQHQAARTWRSTLRDEPAESLLNLDEFARSLGVALADIERLTLVMRDCLPLEELPTFVVATTQPYDKARVLRAIAPSARKRHGIYATGDEGTGKAAGFHNDRVFLVGPAQRLRDLVDRAGASPAKGKWERALHLCVGEQQHTIVAGLEPRLLQQEIDRHPPALAWLFKPLWQARTATLTLDLHEEWQSELRLAFGTEETARREDKALRAVLILAREYLAHSKKSSETDPDRAAIRSAALQGVAAVLRGASVNPRRTEVKLAFHGTLELANALLAEARFSEHQERAARRRSSDNLKQLVQAMLRYHQDQARFPAALVRSKSGKHLHSWRVALLPFLGEETLYQQFKLEEPWNSSHNKKLLSKMPAVFVADAAKGKAANSATHYRVFVGPGAAFEERQPTRLADFTDGAANTLLIVEAAEAVPWTKPEDLTYDAAKPLPPLGSLLQRGFLAALADGSVRFIDRRAISETLLRALITRNGGELLGPHWQQAAAPVISESMR
jgi:hypothetical protein